LGISSFTSGLWECGGHGQNDLAWGKNRGENPTHVKMALGARGEISFDSKRR